MGRDKLGKFKDRESLGDIKRRIANKTNRKKDILILNAVSMSEFLQENRVNCFLSNKVSFDSILWGLNSLTKRELICKYDLFLYHCHYCGTYHITSSERTHTLCDETLRGIEEILDKTKLTSKTIRHVIGDDPGIYIRLKSKGVWNGYVKSFDKNILIMSKKGKFTVYNR